MMVKANVEKGVNAARKTGEIGRWLQEREWPAGIELKFRGADEEQRESRQFLAKAMAGALFLMFMILVTQFDSFYQTAITLSTVLLSVIGVLIGIIVTGQDFSVIMTGTGVIALAGIVVNNSIVLIDTFNHFRRDLKMPAIDAALRSSAQRLRPVLLTTITTICGLAPMAMQINLDFFNRVIQLGSVTSVWWVQLSTAIIFGLGFSTLLTLILTPTLLALPTVAKKGMARFSRFGLFRRLAARRRNSPFHSRKEA
jgi:multidrug efflux pump